VAVGVRRSGVRIRVERAPARTAARGGRNDVA
jgi:hypothetical protein